MDDFDCDALGDTYVQLGAGPATCNEFEDIEDLEINVQGCRFGDDTVGSIKFSKSSFTGAFEITVPDSDDPDGIRAICTAPSGCEIGDPNSEVLFDSKTCFGGLGLQTLVDAQYKCVDFDGVANDQKVCP